MKKIFLVLTLVVGLSFTLTGCKSNLNSDINIVPTKSDSVKMLNYKNEYLYFEFAEQLAIPIVKKYSPNLIIPSFPESDFFNYSSKNHVNLQIRDKSDDKAILLQSSGSGYKGDDFDFEINFQNTISTADIHKIADSIQLLEPSKNIGDLISAYYGSIKTSTKLKSFDDELGETFRGKTQKRKAAFEAFAEHYKNINIYSLDVLDDQKIDDSKHEIMIQVIENAKNGVKKNRKFKDIVTIKDNNLVVITSKEILEDKKEVIFSPKLKASLVWSNGEETIFIEKNGVKSKIAEAGKVLPPSATIEAFHADNFINSSLQFSPKGRYLIYALHKTGYAYNPMEIIDLSNNKLVYKKEFSPVLGFNNAESIFYECKPNPTGETGYGSSDYLNIYEVPTWKIKYSLSDAGKLSDSENFPIKCKVDPVNQKFTFTLGQRTKENPESFNVNSEKSFHLVSGEFDLEL